jgi:hypothetical protein
MTLVKTIEIIALPHGEAPEDVRRGWIGCILPCEPECGHVPIYVGGILSGPSLEKIAGFSVRQDVALQILAQHSPASAAWFHNHGFPREGESFRFKHEEVSIVETLPIEEVSKIIVYDDMETGTMRPIS